MPLRENLLANRLQRARLQLDYSPEELSTASGITSSRIAEIESGSSPPTGDELLILASVFDRNYLDFLEESSADPFQETEILFRRYGSSISKSDRRAIQEFLHLCESEHELQKLLSRQPETFEYTPRGTFFKAHAEDAAKRLRAHLNYDENTVPRDVYSDFRAIGVHIFRRKLENSDISGLYIHHPRAGHCILVNFVEDVYRQRFSVAHEAAHSIFDADAAAVLSYVSDRYMDELDKLREIRANHFAGQYLVPPTIAARIPWPISDTEIQLWANRLRVNTSTLAISISNVHKLSKNEVARISRLRVPPENKLDPECPEHLTNSQLEKRRSLLERGLSTQYVSLCFDALHADAISVGKLSEILKLSPQDLTEVAAVFGRSIHHGI